MARFAKRLRVGIPAQRASVVAALAACVWGGVWLLPRTALAEGLAPTSAAVNYARPFEPPTRPAFIPLPAGAIEPAGWLRDWAMTAREGYTGHMEEVDPAFRQAWAADYKMTGEQLTYWDKGAWPYEGGGYWFDGLVKLGYCLHDASPFGPDEILTQLPAEPVAGGGPPEGISLVPYGCAKFRVAMFPITERLLKLLEAPAARPRVREKAARG